MGEFRPAQPQLANWGGAFQKGFSSSVDAVQNKRDHALKLKTMAMAEERFGWDRKEQVREANLRKIDASFESWDDPLKKMENPWHEATADTPAFFNDAYLSNRFYRDENKAIQYDIWKKHTNAGNPEARKSLFDEKWKAGADAENAKIRQVILNGLVLGGYTDEEGKPLRDKQIYSQLAIGSKNVQQWAREYQPGIGLFDWRADMTTMNKLSQWKDDKLRPGTLTGDVLGNPYVAPLALGAGLGLPIYAGKKAYDKWGKTSKVGEFGGKSKLPTVMNEAETALQRAKDGLKKDGKKFPKTAKGIKAQKAAQTKAQNAVNKAQANIDKYNKRLSGTEKHMRIKKTKSYGKWAAPFVGGKIGSVFGEEGEIIGAGAGGATQAVMTAAQKGRGSLTNFVLRKLGSRIPAAIAVSAADGPLPLGEILSLGIGIKTVWDAIQEYNKLK